MQMDIERIVLPTNSLHLRCFNEIHQITRNAPPYPSILFQNTLPQPTFVRTIPLAEVES